MNERFQKLCRDYKIQTAIDPRLYDKYNVKRGLRNNDGSGVVVGLTNICCVHGYVIDEGEKRPAPGQLIYRGYGRGQTIEDYRTKKGRKAIQPE